MTTVTFHFNVGDTVAYTCRLARKAVSTGAKLVILVEEGALNQIDSDLWQLSAVAFVPHCGPYACANVIARSPVFLTQTLMHVPHHDVLVNLTTTVPIGFDAFDRIIEIVGLDEERRQAARQRWRSYAGESLQPMRHDVTCGGEA